MRFIVGAALATTGLMAVMVVGYLLFWFLAQVIMLDPLIILAITGLLFVSLVGIWFQYSGETGQKRGITMPFIKGFVGAAMFCTTVLLTSYFLFELGKLVERHTGWSSGSVFAGLLAFLFCVLMGVMAQRQAKRQPSASAPAALPDDR